MRTRNRGQRTSIVSSLGLCPKNRKAKCLKKLVKKPHQNTRRLLGKRVKQVVKTFTRRSTKRNVEKNEMHESKQPTENMLLQLFSAHKSQKRYATSKLKLTNDNSSSSKHLKTLSSRKDLSCNSAVSVQSKELSRGNANAVTRGRKRQFTKVGKPKLGGSTESRKKDQMTKPPAEFSRSRRSHDAIGKELSESKPTMKKEITPENPSTDAQMTSIIKPPRVYSRRQSSGIVQKQKTNEPVIRRPRGRPRASVTTKATDKPYSTKQRKKRLIHINPSSDTELLANRGACTQESHYSTTSIISPKLIKIEDMYYANELKFGAADGVLQELLQEVNASGVVPRASGFSDELLNLKTEEKLNSNAVFTFDVPIVESVFKDLWHASDEILKLDAKDLFLALNGLLRPGICELWRRRMDEQSKKLSRSHMGRLRPNPRPRRYSDMFIPNGDGKSVTVNHHPVSEVAHIAGKVRSGSRSVAVAAATKKLIRAKTHHKRNSRVIANAARSLTEASFQLLREGEDLNPRSRRKSRQAANRTQVSLPSRTRRRPDVSHHIDWKFCYAHSEKQNSTVIITTPKRRRRMEPSSPDKPQIPPIVIQPDSEGVGFVNDSPSASCDTDTPSATTHEESVLPITNTDVGSDQTKPDASDIADTHVLQMNQSLAGRLGVERSVDGRRKRRHALTVQRKRPVERTLPNYMESERLLWRTEHATDKGDPLSDSSVTSVSLNGNNNPGTYDSSFRHTKWIRPPTPKPKGKTERKCELPSGGGSKPANRSVTLPRPRIMVGGLHARRSGRNSQLYSYVSHRSRTSRRPDRMCQLTLLDRLVLGLNCSVAQNDNEIHIKRLHEDELSILTQRINKTGFSVRSLSVRESVNNDAEYNIVLTLSPNSDASVRRARSNSLATRSHIFDSDHSTERSSRESSGWITKQKLKSRQFTRYTCDSRNSSRRSSIRSALQPILRHPDSTQLTNSGYHSDTDLLTKKPKSRKLRRVRSDTDLLDPVFVTSGSSFFNDQRDQGSLSVHIHNRPFVPSEVDDERNLPIVSTASIQSSKEWLRSTSSQNRIAPSLGERRFVSETVTQKRAIQPSRSVLERPSYDTDIHPVASVSTHNITKRPLGMETLTSNYLTPFRRHSPRKVIRKVYTGSSTIPKILNRKRPTGSNVNMSIPSCSAQPTSSLFTLTHPLPSTVSSSSCTNTLPTSTCTSSISSSTSSTIVFDEHAQALPVCPPTSVAGFSLQYHRFPSPVIPVTVVPATAKLVDQSINLNPASSSTTLFNENRSSGVLRFRTVPTIPIGSNLPQVSVKPPDRIHLGDVPNPSLAARHLSSGVPLSGHDDSEHNPPASESKGLDSKTSSENPTSTNSTTAITTTIVTTTTTTTTATEVKVSPIPTTIMAPSLPINEPTTMTTTATSLMRSSELPQSRPLSVTYSLSNTDDLANLASPEASNCENELPTDLDGSYTPATSMSASQLLKLKRLHDETGRSVASPGGPMHLTESRTNPTPPASLYSTFPNRVQSPQTLPLQGKQAQSIHQEITDNPRPGKLSQFESNIHERTSSQEPHHHHQQQQHQQYQQQQRSQQQQHFQCTSLSTHPQYASGVCSVSSAVIGSDSLITPTVEPVSMTVVNEDADEFELKSVDQPTGRVFYSSVGGISQSSFHPREISPFVSSPYCCASTPSDIVRLSATSAPRIQRLPWSSMRPTGPLTSSFLTPGVTRFHPSANVVRDTESGTVNTSADSLTSDQVTARTGMSPCLSMDTTMISSLNATASTSDSSSVDQQRALSCNPLSLPHTGSVNAFDQSAQTLNVTAYNQSNSLPLSGVPLKRTIVHKYHSFRKILPKSPERLSQFVSTSTFHAMPNLSNASASLTQLPLLGSSGSSSGTSSGTVRMYRAGSTGSFSQPSLLSCDSTGETAYFVDISTNLSDSTGIATRTTDHPASFGFHAYTTSTSTTGSMMNPASQLLKSLLESGDSKEGACTVFTVPIHQHTTLPHLPSSGLRKTTPNVSNSTGTVAWNQPAHQSRGTWQLGKRVQSTPSSSSSRPTSEGSAHSRPGSTTEPRDTSDASIERYPTASSVKLTPGSSKSRLQQLQQHYQRRQQLQQAQPKQQQHSPPPLPVDQSAQAHSN